MSVNTDYSGESIICYPALWPLIPITQENDGAHSTILYFENDKIPVGETELRVLLLDLNMTEWLVVNTAGVEMFGPEKDIPVVRIEHRLLQINYEKIVTHLAAAGVYSSSEFGYNPHVTIRPEDIPYVPDQILLGAPEVWWNE